MADQRDLTAQERQMLDAILTNGSFPGVNELRDQLLKARVAGGTPTLLDLEVAPSAKPSAAPDGPIPIRAFVRDQAGEPESEIIVWVKDGYLSGLELAWVTDEPPLGFPPPERIHISRT